MTAQSPLNHSSGERQSVSKPNQAVNQHAQSDSLKDHLKEYDRHKDFLVNADNVSVQSNRSLATWQMLRAWDEKWDHVNGAQEADGWWQGQISALFI